MSGVRHYHPLSTCSLETGCLIEPGPRSKAASPSNPLVSALPWWWSYKYMWPCPASCLFSDPHAWTSDALTWWAMFLDLNYRFTSNFSESWMSTESEAHPGRGTVLYKTHNGSGTWWLPHPSHVTAWYGAFWVLIKQFDCNSLVPWEKESLSQKPTCHPS